MRGICWRVAIFLISPISLLRADQIEMQNGDRYSGTVLSMTADTIVLQSEILGQLKVPRAKVSTITLGATTKASATVAPATNSTKIRRSGPAQTTDDSTSLLKQLGANTNLIDVVRNQFLADADPQSNKKFDDLLTGLMTGKLDMNDLRAEAKSAADQVRAMKKDSGDAAGELQAYLDVLDHFLSESAPPAADPSTNTTRGTVIIR